MDLFDLVAKITLDSSQYEQGLRDAEGKASGFGSTLKTAMKVGGAAVAAVGTAAIGLSTAFVAGAGSVAEYGDNIDKMSQKMGLSAQAYQEWDAIMQHSGTSMETMKAGMKTLANAVESGNDAFQRIGLTQKQIASMSQEDLFAATIAGLQNVENETERTYLAGQLLGRGATELGALLNTSAEDTEAMRQRVHELGGVMSDDAVKASARYQDSLQDMKTAFSGLSRNMMSEFLPSIATVMDGLSELFSGGDGLGKISEGINQFVSNLSAALPRVMQTGSEIVLALGDAIVGNLPVLFEAATQFILTLGQGIVQNLPMLVGAALQIIVMLANGISQSLPELIPTIVDVILQIVDTLIENVDMLIDAALEIIVALAEGLIDALPKLLAKAPEIVMKLVAAVIENAPKLLKAAYEIIKNIGSGIKEKFGDLTKKGGEILTKVKDGILNGISTVSNIGRNIVEGIWNGISNGLQWIKDKISGWVGDVTGFIKGLFGIHSPSTVMRDEVGLFLAKGIGVGFEQGMKDVEKSMRDSMPDLTSGYDFNVTGSYSPYDANGYGSTLASGVSIYGDVSITIDGAGKNAEEIGRDLYKMLVRQGVAAYAY